MQKTNITLAALAAYFVFIVLLHTSVILPATWDEGEFGSRVDSAGFWIHRVLLQIPVVNYPVPRTALLERLEKEDTFADLCSAETIEKYWRGTTNAEGHPQFPVFVSVLGRVFTGSFFPEKDSYRYGPLVFFSLAAGAVFYRLKKDFDTTTAMFCIGSILLIPRLFAHCQIAAWDSVLTSSWLLAWAVMSGERTTENYLSTCFRLRYYSLFVIRYSFYGFILGLTAASKFSGLGVLIPFYILSVYQVIKNRRSVSLTRLTLAALFLIHFSLLITFLFFNPPLWNNPAGGIAAWFFLNTHRDINVAVLFFGTMYDLYHSLPWYNTLVWTVITVPVGILFCFFYGLTVLFKDKEKRRTGLFLVLNMLPLLVLRSLPGTPVHDGERMFEPAFAFLGIIAGFGAAAMWTITNDTARKEKRVPSFLIPYPLRRSAAGLIYAAALLNLFWYAPQWLSYYNVTIGGLPGAVRAGMEPTYWWDGFDGEVIDWLYANTQENDKIAFSAGSVRSLELSVTTLKFKGKTANIHRHFEIIPPETTLEELQRQGFRYYVLQCRPSAVFSRDEELLQQKTPVFIKTIREGGWGAWNLAEVPLLKIFDVKK